MVTILGIILCQMIYSQSVSSIAVDFTKLDRVDEFIAAPNIKWDVKKHSWSIGPTVLVSFGDQIEERESLKLTGLQVGFENFIHGKSNKWNLFHSFKFYAQRIKDEQNSQFFDLSSSTFQSNKIEQVENSLLLTGNVGVLWNFSEKVAATSTLGAGVNTVFRNTQSELDDFDDLFIRQVWVFKIGLRYNITSGK